MKKTISSSIVFLLFSFLTKAQVTPCPAADKTRDEVILRNFFSQNGISLPSTGMETWSPNLVRIAQATPTDPYTILSISLNTPTSVVIPANFYNICPATLSLTIRGLSTSNATGIQLSDSIQKLAGLRSLIITNAGLKDSLPRGLYALLDLEELDLSQNFFFGEMPFYTDNYWTKLRSIRIADNRNKLSGSLPRLQKADSLRLIDFSNGQFTSTIPVEWGQLKALTDINLSFTGNKWDTFPTAPSQVSQGRGRIFGTIPNSFSNLSNLQRLNLRGNQLSGTLPPNLSDWTQLRYLNLSTNRFSGVIPATIGVCRQLDYLDLSANGGSSVSAGFNGLIPTTINNLSALTYLDLSENYSIGAGGDFPLLNDSLPKLAYLNLSATPLGRLGLRTSFGTLKNLKTLLLTSSQLSPTNLSELGKLSQLTTLNISFNSTLAGTTFPTAWGSLSNLEYLSMAGNSMVGNVPKELASISKLRSADLSGNNFEGAIPPQYAALAQLQYLNLADNKFISGKLPAEFANATNLSYLNLRGNLMDSVPDLSKGSFGNPPTRTVDLSNNRLSFDDILPNIRSGFSTTYSPQAEICKAQNHFILAGDSFVLDLKIDGAMTTNVYAWYKNGKLIEKTTVNRLTFPKLTTCDMGMYECRVSNPAAPSLTLFCRGQFLDIPAAPCDLNLPFDLTLYPNPVAKDLNVRLQNPPYGGRYLRIYNALGNLVLEKTLTDPELLLDGAWLSLGDLAKGLYILSFHTEGGQILGAERFLKL